MRGREKAHFRRRMMRAAVLALTALLALAVASPAVAKKKKAKSPAVTAVASTPLSPGGQTSATAGCPSKTHVTGGGWSLSDPYSPNGSNSPAGGAGTRITHLQSQPSGLRSWTSGAAALATPATSGAFTSIARCESKSLGRTLLGVSGSTTVPVSQESTSVLHCSPGTHVLSGGFSFSPPGSPGPNTFRASVVESRRTSATTWEVDLINPAGAPSQVTLSLNVLCELNQKGVSVTEASAISPIADNGRTSATAACKGKTHTIGGGFLLSPKVGPAIGVDQMQPVGAKSWQVGLYEYPGFALPTGSSMAAYSYCKKNAIPKK
ncbi:MAG TPA: hypothetical protein VHU24_08605 [Solirubrobacterales bacterium]|nr:hypothetical protein [Solirubrobacterales bacterium]